MMTSPPLRDEAADKYTGRRGHLSISDPSHHVTEAIGTLYGDEDDSGSEGGGRPLSFVDGSSYHDHMHQSSQISEPDSRRPLLRSNSDEPFSSHQPYEDHAASLKKSHTLQIPSPNRRSSRLYETSSPQGSPVLSLRDVQADASGSQFPLTNIDNPKDIAQELSNLQALRRMSMDVGNSNDPDMPPMGFCAMPIIAPTRDDDENDPSRLLWVPAGVHPELAPSEFKSFLENRVQSIRRRSGESLLSTEGDPKRSDSDSLRRRRSMLSRQIDNSVEQGAVGYVDGAERPGRKESTGGCQSPELSLDDLVRDPTRAVQKFALESQGASVGEDGSSDDMPILPMAPGIGLRRSTRTTYRKGGSLRSGDRIPFSKRMAQRQQEVDGSHASTPPNAELSQEHTLDMVQSEPTAENFSRPTRSVRRRHNVGQDSPSSSASIETQPRDDMGALSPAPLQEQLNVRTKSQSSPSPPSDSIPQDDRHDSQDDQSARSYPQKSFSHNPGSVHQDLSSQTPEVGVEDPPAPQAYRNPATSPNNYSIPQPSPQTQYVPKTSPSHQVPHGDAHGSSSSSLLGGDASRTDSLTVIPTFSHVDKKIEKKSRKDKDDDSASTSSKSGGAWKWLKGVTDDKDKKREESKRAKAKASAEKGSDNARLDVIQSSIEKTAVKGRESLVLDRDSIDSKLVDERKKESHRKGDTKKDKDGSIFSSIFGGSKRREEKEKATKKTQYLQVPEPPVYKPLQPDVDYNWTRFPLLEERAIYRMAHIKLANSRRPLLSQVLLSNFMYSYLAIVQAMHPQMNVPTSPQQKRLEEEARRKRREQEYASQQQLENGDAENSLEQYNFDYHRVSRADPCICAMSITTVFGALTNSFQAAVQYAESGPGNQVDYVDEAEIYEDDHGTDNQEGYYDDQDGYGHSVKDYYQYQNSDSNHRRHGGDGTW
ncbi:hypothetical protein E4U42_003738 [Claviceps africana]|uniref:Protein Zds1 C-terminal domain-containing protein n=1 Tax=Claviceps africana TaxID=83212 RepID=A0A8K0J6J6_9HYPO|nr:hypothetical protein E4U42_003738 [Claviceps africana]